MKTLERIEFKILHNLFVLQNLNSFAKYGLSFSKIGQIGVGRSWGNSSFY